MQRFQVFIGKTEEGSLSQFLLHFLFFSLDVMFCIVLGPLCFLRSHRSRRYFFFFFFPFFQPCNI